MRPPTMVGWAQVRLTPAKAKAHFSLSLGTWGAGSPAMAEGWKRCCVRPAPHPFQYGLAKGSVQEAPVVGQAAGLACVSAAMGAAPVRNSATAEISAALRPKFIFDMLPLTSAVRMFSGAICLRAARLGARSTPWSWQRAQFFW